MENIFKTISRKTIYENKWIKVFENKILRKNIEGTYSVIERDDSVVIIPLTKNNKSVLLRQYRYPTEDSNSWEFPMGGIDLGETPLHAARRELYEETQLSNINLTNIGTFFCVPGLTSQKVSVFIAEITEIDLEKAFRLEFTDEILEYKILTIHDIEDMIFNNLITDGFTLSSFAKFGIYQQNKV